MTGYDMTNMWGWATVMTLLMPLFWALLIGGAIWLIVRLTRTDQGASGPSHERTSLGILEERLARGEIDIQEFRDRRSAITEGH